MKPSASRCVVVLVLRVGTSTLTTDAGCLREVTLRVYGHMFDADLDDLAVRLEELGRDVDGMTIGRLSERLAAQGR